MLVISLIALGILSAVWTFKKSGRLSRKWFGIAVASVFFVSSAALLFQSQQNKELVSQEQTSKLASESSNTSLFESAQPASANSKKDSNLPSLTVGSDAEKVSAAKQLKLSFQQPFNMAIPRGKQLKLSRLSCDVLVSQDGQAKLIKRGQESVFSNPNNGQSKIKLQLIGNNIMQEDKSRSYGAFSSSRERTESRTGCRIEYHFI